MEICIGWRQNLQMLVCVFSWIIYRLNNIKIIGRDRWVELAHKRPIYDASEIAPEWYMWLHHVCDQPPTPEEVEGRGRAVKPIFFPNYTGDNSKRYYPPGHFFNPLHINPINSQRVKPFNPSNSDHGQKESDHVQRESAWGVDAIWRVVFYIGLNCTHQMGIP